jgi:hypothetical protein
MPFSSAQHIFNKLSMGLIALISITLVACGGGGGGGGSSSNPPTPADIAAITPAQIATYSAAQIVALDSNIQYLTNPTLGAMLTTQVNAITATEIGVLSPAQVRFIGSTGAGGATTTSKITSLNAGAWAALVGNPTQVAAITPAETATMSISEIPALGTNIQYLSNPALGAFITSVTFNQIGSILATQIAVLSPAQVRFIGSTGAGGATTTSKINSLNAGAWAQLVSDPLQVASITAAEAATMSVTEIPAIGTNIQFLSNAALGAFISSITFNQIGSISAAEIAVLSPAQIRFIGSRVGGVTSTSKIAGLNAGTWAQLVSDPLQVAAITAAEIPTLASNAFAITKIVAFGTNIQYLSLPATAALTAIEKAALTAAQLAAMTTAQHTACGC